MATKKLSSSRVKSSVKKDVSRSTAKGKVDLERLRERNAPLAAVLDEFVRGKTSRDDPTPIIKELQNVLDARDPSSRLGKALANLEKSLAGAGTKSAGAKKASAKKPLKR